MNTVKQWMRATRALGFALVLAVDPACAAVIVDSLSADPTSANLHGSHAPSCDAASATSVIAYSHSGSDSAQHCASAAGGQGVERAATNRGRHMAEPAAGSLWFPPTDGRRYSF